jgi:integrase
MSMTTLKRDSSTGAWTAKKGIPAECRETYKRLYGQRFEIKARWPASLSPAQAKARFGAWLAEVESRITNIRVSQKSAASGLSERQRRAIAGVAYRDTVAAHEANPGDAEGWELSAEAMEDVIGLGPDDVIVGLEPVADAVVNAAAARHGVAPTAGDRRKLAAYLAEAKHAAFTLLASRARGDYSPDRQAERFPPLEAKAVSPVALFDGWAAERKPAASTATRWRAIIEELAKFYPDAGAITEDQARAWVKGLMTADRGAVTIRNNWRRSANVVFGWAVENKLIASNPFAAVKAPRGRLAPELRSKAFTAEEAATILAKALASKSNAKRWVPWLQAYSGCRGGEAAGLRGQDIREIDGHWCMVLTPTPDRSIKTGAARTVPLHPHLVEQGFLDFARSRGNGPLFYDPAKGPRGKRSQPDIVLKSLQTWVRDRLSIRGVAPTHAWRHLFKQLAYRAGISERLIDEICGHAPASIGRGYGKPTVSDLAAALVKFPKFEV